MSGLTNLPGIGPWFARIGYVAELEAYPCNPTEQMWAQGFFTAIPYLIWSLFKPDPIDATWTRFGMPGATHRRARWKNARSIRGLLMPGPINGRRTAMWTLGELAQRIGWWFCIIDAGTNFAVNWVSATYQYAGCLPENLPASYGVTDHGWVTSPGESGFVPFSTITDPRNRLGFDEIVFRTGDPKGFSIGAVAQPWSSFPNNPGSVAFDVRIKPNGPIIKDLGLYNAGEGPGRKLAYFKGNTGRYLKAHTYAVGLHYQNVGPGFADLNGCTFSAQNSHGNNILADPL